MADAKLSALALATQVDRVYGEVGGVSKAIVPSDIRGPILSKAGNYTVLAADNGTHFNNVGAAGAVNFSLPAAAAGLSYAFVCVVAQTVTLTCNGTDKIAVGPDNSSAGGTLSTAEPFNAIIIEPHGTGQWVALSITGTWTVT